jgi:predicted RNase H-like nuclease (RuvC/YqgF family)
MRYEQYQNKYGFEGEPLYVRVETPSDEFPPTTPNSSNMHNQNMAFRERIDTLSEKLDAQSDDISAKNDLIKHLKDKVDALGRELSSLGPQAVHDRNCELHAEVKAQDELIEYLRDKVEQSKTTIAIMESKLLLSEFQVEELENELLLSESELFVPKPTLAHREEVIDLKETIMELREKCHHLENELDMIALEDIS